MLLNISLAQSVTTRPRGYDVLLIIDQSGSMSGHLLGSKAHPHPNDRFGRRTEAAHIIISGLMEASEKGYSGGQQITYRLSIIEFGSQSNLMMDWTEIKFDPNETDIQRNALISQMNQKIVNKNLGDTHFISAFELVENQLKKINYGSDLGFPRGIMILLTTDGKPYSEDTKYFSGDHFLATKYSNDLYQTIKKQIIDSPDNKAVNTLFNVIAINDADTYWDRVGPFWRRLATYTKLIDNNMDNVEFQNEIKGILNQFTFPPSIKVDGDFDCPCYVKKLIITVFEPMPGITAVIKKPDGVKLDTSIVLIEKGLTYTKYKIKYPMPGLWKISSQGKTSVHIDFIYDQVELITPKKDSRIPPMPFRPIWKLYSSRNGQQKTFKKIDGCPIEAITIITAPDGSPSTVPMDLTPNGEFIGRVDYLPTIPGRYRIIFRATTRTTDGKEIEIISSQDLYFDVTDARPVLIEILKPKRGINLFFGKTKVHVRVRFVSFNDPNLPIPVKDVALNPEQFLKIQFFSKINKEVSEQIFLKTPSTKDPSILIPDNLLEGDIPLKRKYQFFHSLLRLGKYKMKLSFEERELNSEYFIYKIEKLK